MQTMWQIRYTVGLISCICTKLDWLMPIVPLLFSPPNISFEIVDFSETETELILGKTAMELFNISLA